MIAQLDRLKLMIPEEKNVFLLQELLNQAEDVIKQRRRAKPDSKLEKQYHTLQIQIAVYLYNKMGAEGETTHNENGVNRTYENGHIPNSMLKSIVPLGVVM